jgi:hypothetical protein
MKARVGGSTRHTHASGRQTDTGVRRPQAGDRPHADQRIGSGDAELRKPRKGLGRRSVEFRPKAELAPQAGFEPATLRLTAPKRENAATPRFVLKNEECCPLRSVGQRVATP